jgi:hypothetical protein
LSVASFNGLVYYLIVRLKVPASYYIKLTRGNSPQTNALAYFALAISDEESKKVL